MMKETPIIAIYKDGMQYRVEIDGKEIERLKRFELKLDAVVHKGVSEPPTYAIEQYFPISRPIQDSAKQAFRQSPEEQEAKP